VQVHYITGDTTELSKIKTKDKLFN